MPEQKRILVAEDDVTTHEDWCAMLASWGYEVKIAEDGEKAFDLPRTFQPHILLSDLRMPHRDGLNLLRDIRELHLETLPIIISGVGEIPDAVQAIKLGAADYLSKPIDPPHLQQILKKLTEHIDVREENLRLRRRLVEVGELGPLFGKSLAMRRVLTSMERLAESSASVIITGESGTGKELAARTIHQLSSRKNAPFIVINCAAIPQTLMESELFGHERGAFTGADRRREGCFELANGGTLLLDEITEMKPELQAKLLRVIEERKLRRVGGSSDIALNVRVLAATNRDLVGAIRQGRLREDLYYRLNVFTIALPRLVERLDDLPVLADHFVRDFARANSRNVTAVDNACLEALKARSWPGNVRELRNVIERAVIVTTGPLIAVADLPAERAHAASPAQSARPSQTSESSQPAHETQSAPVVSEPPESDLPLGQPLREMERQLILKTLEMTGGNRLRTAEILGISPKTLYNKLGRYQAKATSEKSDPAKPEPEPADEA